MEATNEDRILFAEMGILCLRGCIPKDKTQPAKDAVFRELERLKIRENGKWQAKQLADGPPFKIAAKIAQSIRHQPQFDEVIFAKLHRYVDSLGGIKSKLGQLHPQLLITPPQKERWQVPHLGWHLDIGSPFRDEISGIQVFALIDNVAPKGGGTLAIAGSHKLHPSKGSSAKGAHQILREDPIYSKLFESNDLDRGIFLNPTLVNGVKIQVIEMSGKSGDVYLMDMRVLHAPAINATKNPRIMLTSRYLR